MSTHANMVQMGVTSIASAGEGTITLGAALTGFQHINAAITANATVDITITNTAGAFETCRNCTYTYSATPSSCTITRGTLESGSNGASRVAFDTGGTGVTVSVVCTAYLGNRTEMALRSVTPGGRLTLESGVPVSETDQTAKTTIYYTPYVHNIINLWDGAEWVSVEFAEHTVTGSSLTGLTSGKPYDVFAYLSSGALATELLAWTDDTNRATAVTLQDGRYCKSGDKTRFLLGTIYTTGTTTTESSKKARYVANVYNKVEMELYATDGSANTYTTASVREWGGGTGLGASRFQFVQPIGNNSIIVGTAFQATRSAGILGYFGVGINSTTSQWGAVLLMSSSTANFRTAGAGVGTTVAGLNYVAALQYGESGVSYQRASIGGSVPC